MKTLCKVCCCLFAAVAAFGFAARAADYDLPDGYIPVPYIESTGAQSVPIGYSPTKNTALEFAFTTLTYNDGDTFFGASWGGTAYLLTEQNNKFCFWLQSSYTQVGGTFKTNTDYSFTVANGTSTMTTAGEEPYVVENLNLNDSYGSLYLFGFSSGHRCKYRFKRMKIWDSAGGTLKRDLVPCIQKGDGETLTPGLYDLENEKFYTDTIKTTPFRTGELWFEVGDIPQQEYDGITPCCPEPTVTHQLTCAAMQKDVDYELSYENNDRLGTGTVTIQGLGKYADATLTRTFTIVEKKFRMQFAQAIPDQIFDGARAVEPREFITIIDGEAEVGTPLTEGADYELEFRDNDRVGVATVVARGKNTYAGETAVAMFNIIRDPTLPPDGYVRLAYLRSNSKQTIDLGFVPDKNTSVSLASFRYVSYSGGIGDCLFAQNFMGDQYLLQDQYNKLVWFGSGDTLYAENPVGKDIEFSIRADGTDKGGVATIVADGGDPVVTSNLSMKCSSANLTLFSANGGGNKSSVVFRRLTFEKNGTVFRDFVPCRRMSDNKVGVFDMAHPDSASSFRPNSTGDDFPETPSFRSTNLSVSAVADAWIVRGTPYRPTITVTDVEKGETLAAGTHYKLVWQAEDHTGTYTVYAIGIGEYNGAHAFTQYQLYLPTFDIAPIPNAMYSAESPYRPEVTVTDYASGDLLVENEDYVLQWPPDDLSGDVTLTVVGLNRYVGYSNTTTYRLLQPQTVDEYFDASTAPQSAYTIGNRRIYVFDYTDGGEVCVVTKQTMTLGEALVVGGGGAGGTCIGGGGGGGGVLTPKPNKAIAAGTRMYLTVGGGGIVQPEAAGSWLKGRSGDESSLRVGNDAPFIAFGGGGGGPFGRNGISAGSPRSAVEGHPLASGGGYGGETPDTKPVDGEHYSSSQGNPGGVATTTGSGGGGGAGLNQAGGKGTGGIAGSGGEGILSSICGYPVFQGCRAVYGSGGGGGAGNQCVTPGRRGTNAGDGSVAGSGKQGENAINGFGGGGGGGSYSGSAGTKGGAGGHGRVILSFFVGDTSGKTLAVEPLKKTLSANPQPRVYDPSDPAKVLRPGVDFRYEWKTNNPRATRENPGQGVVVAVGLGDYAGVSADTWYDSFRPDGFMLMIR